MTKLLATAAIAIALGAPAVSQAAPATISVTEKPAVAQAGCFYRYQYYYVNGVLYYQYRYVCY